MFLKIQEKRINFKNVVRYTKGELSGNKDVIPIFVDSNDNQTATILTNSDEECQEILDIIDELLQKNIQRFFDIDQFLKERRK